MKRIYSFTDPRVMPVTGLTPELLFGQALPIAGTAGEGYALRRAISSEVAAHVALDDALEQGRLFCNMLAESRR